MDEAERQKIYRARQAERFERRGNALKAIIARLGDNDKPLAIELRAIAENALL